MRPSSLRLVGAPRQPVPRNCPKPNSWVSSIQLPVRPSEFLSAVLPSRRRGKSEVMAVVVNGGGGGGAGTTEGDDHCAISSCHEIMSSSASTWRGGDAAHRPLHTIHYDAA